ncbi:hypothetical protein NB696_003689 [Xanthomonas sacchari]|nr:hypothetical protein [Xanthomonas sacchari]
MGALSSATRPPEDSVASITRQSPDRPRQIRCPRQTSRKAGKDAALPQTGSRRTSASSSADAQPADLSEPYAARWPLSPSTRFQAHRIPRQRQARWISRQQETRRRGLRPCNPRHTRVRSPDATLGDADEAGERTGGAHRAAPSRRWSRARSTRDARAGWLRPQVAPDLGRTDSDRTAGRPCRSIQRARPMHSPTVWISLSCLPATDTPNASCCPLE